MVGSFGSNLQPVNLTYILPILHVYPLGGHGDFSDYPTSLSLQASASSVGAFIAALLRLGPKPFGGRYLIEVCDPTLQWRSNSRWSGLDPVVTDAVLISMRDGALQRWESDKPLRELEGRYSIFLCMLSSTSRQTEVVPC